MQVYAPSLIIENLFGSASVLSVAENIDESVWFDYSWKDLLNYFLQIEGRWVTCRVSGRKPFRRRTRKLRQSATRRSSVFLTTASSFTQRTRISFRLAWKIFSMSSLSFSCALSLNNAKSSSVFKNSRKEATSNQKSRKCVSTGLRLSSLSMSLNSRTGSIEEGRREGRRSKMHKSSPNQLFILFFRISKGVTLCNRWLVKELHLRELALNSSSFSFIRELWCFFTFQPNSIQFRLRTHKKTRRL